MTKRLSVAMVAACPFPCQRGTPVRIFRLAEALSTRGHDVHVVTYHLGDPVDSMPFTVHRIPKVPTYRKSDPGPNYQKLLVLDVLLAFKLREVLKGERFDIIHAHHYEGLIAALAGRPAASPPIIFDVHTLLESELPYYGLGLPFGLKRWVGRILDRELPKRAAGIIAVAEEIQDKLIQSHGIDPRKITLAPGGVELDLFPPASMQPGQPVTRTRTLIYAGSLAAYQRIDLMLEAFSEVFKERKDVRLLVVTNSRFEPYEMLASRLGIREEIDAVSAELAELAHHLGRADIALNPRIECDGYPQKILNYMAAAKPIVTFAGSAKGLAHGTLAWVVEDGDVSAFAGGIMKLLDNPELAWKLGHNAREHVAREHGWGRAAERVERAYQRVLARAHRAPGLGATQ